MRGTSDQNEYIYYFCTVHQESPLRSANRAARSHGGKAMRIVQHQKKYGTMKKKCMYQLVVVQNGQYGFVHKDNERRVLDHPFKTYDAALSAASRRYNMLHHYPGNDDILEGTLEDFTITVNGDRLVHFSEHYFIEVIE